MLHSPTTVIIAPPYVRISLLMMLSWKPLSNNILRKF